MSRFSPRSTAAFRDAPPAADGQASAEAPATTTVVSEPLGAGGTSRLFVDALESRSHAVAGVGRADAGCRRATSPERTPAHARRRARRGWHGLAADRYRPGREPAGSAPA